MLKSFLKGIVFLFYLFSGGSCHFPKPLELENITDVIKQVLVDYDIRLRPNFGGKPLYIGMDLNIASFDSISEVNMVSALKILR
ncbi:putative GABA-activated chloride channel [Trichonephila inaurata madagascariensis]|uniref:Putative GABA-activated chloride channel n=1 Tax=Trichonephila inaurata madagascariensis TaxID=2747483 RepID=A0A8X7CNS0_9ARAC|nr:putative GABA-activated chloride channel [Trichonephila inaurata madagascariensis]